MQTIQTLIVDDESIARDGLRRMLERESDVDVVGECGSGREAVDAIRALAPDLVFMDVQMPEMNGFEALATLAPDTLPVVVFVTAYDQYALRAFDMHAVDYLLKPFSNRRLQEALDQARAAVASDHVAQLQAQVHALLDRLDDDAAPRAASGDGPGDAADAASTYERASGTPLQRIPIKKRRQVLFVDVDDIDWIEAADNYVQLHVGDDTHLVRVTLTELEDRLDGEHFLRIHRSTIVNVDRIRELHPRGSGDCEIVLDDGTHLRSSRTYNERRREVLDL